MQSIIALTIHGELFFFEDTFTNGEKEDIQNIANAIPQESFKQNSEVEICKYFVEQVSSRLGIFLHSVKVSFVVRIN